MKNIILLSLLMPLAGVGQKIENLEASTEGNKIIITYDIVEGVTGDTYDVQLYASHNNYSSPVRLVSGEVGKALNEGRKKKIEWDAKAELGNYSGDLSFELRVMVTAALAIQSRVSSIKRGKDLELTWRGGSVNHEVKIELLQSGATVGTLEIVPNSGSWQWPVPTNQPVGNDFQLRLVNGKESVVTEPFSIRHKIPTALKAAPLALLVVFALPGSTSATSESPRTSTKITAASLN